MPYAVIQVNDDGVPTDCTIKANYEEAISMAIAFVEEKKPSSYRYKDQLREYGWYGEPTWLVAVLLTK